MQFISIREGINWGRKATPTKALKRELNDEKAREEQVRNEVDEKLEIKLARS